MAYVWTSEKTFFQFSRVPLLLRQIDISYLFVFPLIKEKFSLIFTFRNQTIVPSSAFLGRFSCFVRMSRDSVKPSFAQVEYLVPKSWARLRGT